MQVLGSGLGTRFYVPGLGLVLVASLVVQLVFWFKLRLGLGLGLGLGVGLRLEGWEGHPI